MKPKNLANKEPLCVDLEFRAITEIIEPYPRTLDEINLQEEDVIAYIQLMDEIDPTNGNCTGENKSFLTQLVKQGVIKRKTVFFEPLE